MAGFAADLADGKKGERHVGKALKEHYHAEKLILDDDGKKHDLSLVLEGGKTIRIEVKTDFKAKTTGNFYCEFECSGKQSGLTATKADKWAVLVPGENQIYVFSPAKLAGFMLDNSDIRIVKGGDRLATKGYLVPLAVLRSLPFVEVLDTNTRIKKNG